MEYITYVLNYFVIIAWGISIIYALVKLRNMPINQSVRAIWAAMIVFVPVIGVIAFILITSKQQT
jgi:Na+-transporting NADH:ubiquinone oxidoreductase subunit NqrE